MPNLSKIMKRGVYGHLISTVPPISPVAWTSISTGLNPGKHGIFGFLDRHYRPHSSLKLRKKAIWDIISIYGKKSLCLNVPLTYPPYPLREGIMVAGPPSPKEMAYSYPAAVAEELEENVDYKVDVEGLREDYTGMREDEFLRRAGEVTLARAEALLYLMDKMRWDLIFTVFTTPDRVLHVFFGRTVEDSPFYDPRARRSLAKYFKLLDDAIGKVLSALPSDAVVFFVSDHGFEPLFKYVGLLNLIETFSVKHGASSLAKVVVRKLLARSGLSTTVKRWIARLGMTKFAKQRLGGGLECGMGYIYVSDALPREELGALIDLLSSVIDTETGAKVIERIFRRDELYHGPFVKEAPDLVLVPSRGYELRSVLDDVFKEVKLDRGMICKTGTHAGFVAKRGFFAIEGEGVKKGIELRATVYDVAPTALYILGLPVPSYMDGRVLSEVFEEEKLPLRITRTSGLREQVSIKAKRIRSRLLRRQSQSFTEKGDTQDGQ